MPKVYQCLYCKLAVFGSIYSLHEHVNICTQNPKKDTLYIQSRIVRDVQK